MDTILRELSNYSAKALSAAISNTAKRINFCLAASQRAEGERRRGEYYILRTRALYSRKGHLLVVASSYSTTIRPTTVANCVVRDSGEEHLLWSNGSAKKFPVTIQP